MVKLLIASLIGLIFLAGCTQNDPRISPGKSIECQRLEIFWKDFEEDNANLQIIIPPTENASGDEMTWQELGEMIFYVTGCGFCESHPLAKEWTKCSRLDCIWEYLEKENVERIAFYENVMLDRDETHPENWDTLWAEIVEPKRIGETIKLLCKAMKKERNRFANEEIVSSNDRMQITTDKHKFIIPISYYREAIHGIGWTSHELQEQLKEWGFHKAK